MEAPTDDRHCRLGKVEAHAGATARGRWRRSRNDFERQVGECGGRRRLMRA